VKILNRAQFLAAPPGTIYQKCEPFAVDGFLCIKVKECGDNDWFYAELTGFEALPVLGSNHMAEAGDAMLAGGSVPWGTGVGRDGCYDGPEVLFLVHEPDDLRAMAAVLLKAADGVLPEDMDL
jgi:hypothetical protein